MTFFEVGIHLWRKEVEEYWKMMNDMYYSKNKCPYCDMPYNFYEEQNAKI